MTPVELREWRKRRGYSRHEAAAELGVSFETIRKWEQGKHAISATAEKLIEKLDCNLP